MLNLSTLFQGSFGEIVIVASFDEHLSFSLVCETAIAPIATPVLKPNPKRAFNEATGFSIVSNKAVCLDFMINYILLSDEFLVVENLTSPVIIGATTLRKWRIKLDNKNNSLVINPQVAQFRL